MNLASLKTNKKYLVALAAALVLTALLGFYGGRYYERRTFQNRFAQMRNNFQGRQNGAGGANGTNTGPGMMRTFQQNRAY